MSRNVLSVTVFGGLFAIALETLQAVPVNLASIGAYLYLISVAGIFLFYYRRWLVSGLEVTYINSFSHLGKATSILYAVILLGESIAPVSLFCFTLIMAGKVVANKWEKE